MSNEEIEKTDESTTEEPTEEEPVTAEEVVEEKEEAPKEVAPTKTTVLELLQEVVGEDSASDEELERVV